MESQIISWIVSLIAGSAGGNIIGALLKNRSLGPVMNSVLGLVGGGLGGKVLPMLIPALGGLVGGGDNLVGTGGALEHEQAIAMDRAPHDGRQANKRGKALVPLAPRGTGIERLSRVSVLNGDPVCRRFGIPVLEPSIGIDELDAVDGVDDLLTSGRRRSHRLGVSHAPCWDACRGSPSNGASWPSSSWSSST